MRLRGQPVEEVDGGGVGGGRRWGGRGNAHSRECMRGEEEEEKEKEGGGRRRRRTATVRSGNWRRVE
jgi:hypothetical protein